MLCFVSRCLQTLLSKRRPLGPPPTKAPTRGPYLLFPEFKLYLYAKILARARPDFADVAARFLRWEKPLREPRQQ